MTRIFNRQVLGVVLVALLVVTAGCSGLSGSNQTDTDEDSENSATDQEDSDGGSTEEGGSDSSADTTTESSGEMTATESPMGTPPSMVTGDYQFSEGESYTYSSQSGEQSYDLTWEVTGVSGDQLTVEVSSAFGDREQSATLEGTQSEVFRQLSQESSFAIFFLSLRISKQITAGHTLSTGNTWTIQADNYNMGSNAQWETAAVEVTGTDSYSGVQCSNVVVTPDNDQSSFTACVNPDYPFAIAIETTGQQSTTISLSDSSR